jgi:hypothetical protein
MFKWSMFEWSMLKLPYSQPPICSKPHVGPSLPPLTPLPSFFPCPPQVRTALRAFPSLIDRERSIFTGYAMYIAPEVLARMPTLALVMDNGLVFNLPPDVYTTEFRVRLPTTPRSPLPFFSRHTHSYPSAISSSDRHTQLLFLLPLTPPLTLSLLLFHFPPRRRTSPCPSARSR